jgi:hypothetical protein
MNDLYVKIFKFFKLATEKKNILYIVHPTSILEQTKDIRHVKPFLDKLESKINNFDGLVLISILKRNLAYANEPVHFKLGEEYCNKFIDKVKSKSNIFIMEDGNTRPLLGQPLMEKYIDNLYLEDQLGIITIGGCFASAKPWVMCVEDTINNMAVQYGPGHTKVDNSIVMVPGPIVFDKPYSDGWDDK